jgi:hypothetical protein
MTGLKLIEAWTQRLASRAEGMTLYAEADGFLTKAIEQQMFGDKAYAESRDLPGKGGGQRFSPAGRSLSAECALRAANCAKLYAEGDYYHAEAGKYLHDASRLRAAAAKLYAYGELSWINAVLAEYGDIELFYDRQDNCTLENGDTYKGADLPPEPIHTAPRAPRVTEVEEMSITDLFASGNPLTL